MAATFAELTDDEQGTLLSFLHITRTLVGAQIRLHTKLQRAKEYYQAHIASIMAALDTDDIVIPNNTGLAGAQALTKAEVAAVLAIMNDVLATNTQANRDLADACVGTLNIEG